MRIRQFYGLFNHNGYSVEGNARRSRSTRSKGARSAVAPERGQKEQFFPRDERHARRGRAPHHADLIRGEAVSKFTEV